MTKRVFLIVLDSVGIGALPDAGRFGDEGSHTLKACADSGRLQVPQLRRLGLFNIDGIGCGEPVGAPTASYARMCEASDGKDTTIGHWEIAGIISKRPLPTYPQGFPPEIIRAFEKETGRGVLCNKPYSGTQVIADYGEEHLRTGKLIVYTSADSVFQVAAHEGVVPVKQLYAYCEAARALLQGENAVGRVIARPFEGTPPAFHRTVRRHDYSLPPPRATLLDVLRRAGVYTYGIGKIADIFAGRGLDDFVRTTGNEDGMDKTLEFARSGKEGFCFVNLVDFDMLYGHRNDVKGYTDALNAFDKRLGELLPLLSEEDELIITADHGCDPSTKSTDHSREYTPLLRYRKGRQSHNDGTRATFADVAATVVEAFGVEEHFDGSPL